MNTLPGLRAPVGNRRGAFGFFVLLAGLALTLTGCATARKTPIATTAEQRIVTTDYKWVYLTGSHIPVAVPTNPNARPLTNISPITIITPEEIRRMGGPMH